MLGAAGALCCLTAGTALGSWLRERKRARLSMLRAQSDMLSGMRLLLSQERLGMPALLIECSHYAPCGLGADQAARRFLLAARMLEKEPLTSVAEAFAAACREVPAAWEQAEERAALEALFMQLGSGTAAMREQAAATCLRRLKPLVETAQAGAETGGSLCVRLGMLLGLMAGIALW